MSKNGKNKSVFYTFFKKTSDFLMKMRKVRNNSKNAVDKRVFADILYQYVNKYGKDTFSRIFFPHLFFLYFCALTGKIFINKT